MAKTTPDDIDRADVDEGSIATHVGNNATHAWVRVFGACAVSVSGVFVGTMQLECSFDGGATAIAVGDPITKPWRGVIDEPEHGMLYRWRCTAYTSGPVHYRFAR